MIEISKPIIYRCNICNKEFQSQDALIQHLNNKKDKIHLRERDKIYLRKTNTNDNKSQNGIRNGISRLAVLLKIFKLKNKTSLTENEKTELEELEEISKEESKIATKKLIKRFGLPEDTSPEVLRRRYDEEMRLHRKEIEEKLRKQREIARELRKDIKKIDEKSKLEMEQMKKDGWKIVEEHCAKNPNRYVEIIPQFKEENIELQSKKKLKSKNRLLNMSTG